MALPKTYKAAMFKAPNEKLSIEDVELKMPGFGEVLVKVIATGVCGSDRGVQTGEFGNSFPIVPGHETIGDVVAVGEGDKKWKVGDRVGAPWHGGHDGICRQCQRGLFQMCDHAAVNGVTRDGGYAEYVLLRTEAVVRVPKDIDPATYCPVLCAGITVFNSMRKQNIIAGELVGVVGLGGLGHLAVQYAAKLGFRVVAISSGSSKQAFAKELGAHEYIDSSAGDVNKKLQDMGGAALIIATAPNPKVIGPLTGGLQPGGKLLVLAPAGLIEVQTLDLILKAITVSGFPSGHALDSEEAIAFSVLHGISSEVTKFPLKDANQAYEAMAGAKVRGRAVIVMDE